MTEGQVLVSESAAGSRRLLWVALGVLASGLVVIFMLVAFVSDRAGEAFPPEKDVKVTRCSPDGNGDSWQSFGTIVNHSPKRSNYVVTIGYFKGGARIGKSTAIESDVDRAERVGWASGDLGSGDAKPPVVCRVLEVNRGESFHQ